MLSGKWIGFIAATAAMIGIAILLGLLTRGASGQEPDPESVVTKSGTAAVICSTIVEAGFMPPDYVHTVVYGEPQLVNVIVQSLAPVQQSSIPPATTATVLASAGRDYFHETYLERNYKGTGLQRTALRLRYYDYDAQGNAVGPYTASADRGGTLGTYKAAPKGGYYYSLLGSVHADNNWEVLLDADPLASGNYEEYRFVWLEGGLQRSQDYTDTYVPLATQPVTQDAQATEPVRTESATRTVQVWQPTVLRTYWRWDPDYDGPDDARMSHIWRDTPECADFAGR